MDTLFYKSTKKLANFYNNNFSFISDPFWMWFGFSKKLNNLYIFCTLKYLNEKTWFVVFCLLLLGSFACFVHESEKIIYVNVYIFFWIFPKKRFFPLKIRCRCLSKSVLVYSIILRRRFSDNLWFPSGNW